MAITVKILKSELRDTDEIDKTKFTMYDMAVTDAEGKEWDLSRRYSQFHELRGMLAKENKTSEDVPFPPKVLMGKLADSVVEKRTLELEAWMNGILSHEDATVSGSMQVLLFLEAAPGMVQIGGDAPTVALTDIHGVTFESGLYDGTDQVVVYSAASRYNFQKLTEWLKPTQNALTKKYPGIQCVFASIADLRIVPEEGKKMVDPILAKLDAKNSTEMIKDFQSIQAGSEDGGVSMFRSYENYFVPDYTGEALEALNCTDANWTYRLFICHRGKVVQSLQSATKNVAQEYMAAFESLVEAHPAIATPWTVAEGVQQLAEGSETIKAKANYVHDFEISERSIIGWSVQVQAGASSIRFLINRADGVPILPKRTTDSSKTPLNARLLLPPGHYQMVFDNAESTFKSKTVAFKVYQQVVA